MRLLPALAEYPHTHVRRSYSVRSIRGPKRTGAVSSAGLPPAVTLGYPLRACMARTHGASVHVVLVSLASCVARATERPIP